MDNNYTINCCSSRIKIINEGLQPYQTLSFLVPGNDTVWTELSELWYISFTVCITVFALLYLMLGLFSVIMIIKKNCLRLPTRTFFVVYTNMAILGFSRTLFLSLDPFGILGFISDHFSGWIIVSRIFGSFGFPSVVASCTLIIVTLMRLAKVKTGAQWYESWTMPVLITVVTYTISLIAEVLNHTSTYSALFVGLACQIVFTLWGLFICTAFLITGTRLLRKVTTSEKKTLRRSESSSYPEEYCTTSERTKTIRKKITIITFGTAIVGIIYSAVAVVSVTMLFMLILNNCLGYKRKTDSNSWLIVQIIQFSVEIVLAIFVLYSITNTAPLKKLYRKVICCDTCSSGQTVDEGVDLDRPKTCSQSLQSHHTGDTVIELGDIESHQIPINATNSNGRTFKINTQSVSESSELELEGAHMETREMGKSSITASDSALVADAACRVFSIGNSPTRIESARTHKSKHKPVRLIGNTCIPLLVTSGVMTEQTRTKTLPVSLLYTSSQEEKFRSDYVQV